MVRVYLGCSLDGFIAGPDDDLDFLHEGFDMPEGPTEALTFEGFLAQVGCMVMGRTTYDVVAAMDVEWPYGDLPVLVATTRELSPIVPSVRAVSGSVSEILATAREVAGEADVYLDGGRLVQAALAADAVDALCLTMVPVVLGSGKRLFENHGGRTRWTFREPVAYGPFTQVTAHRAR